ncbi:MAG: hypothetical protein KAH77_01725 [Thiomargarita sp.]|nr:hypothetical protein [Thiomargarita sp.]
MAYIDQYNGVFYATTVAGLREQIKGGGSKVSKMYLDVPGGVVHIGYVIGGYWLRAHSPVMDPA